MTPSFPKTLRGAAGQAPRLGRGGSRGPAVGERMGRALNTHAYKHSYKHTNGQDVCMRGFVGVLLRPENQNKFWNIMEQRHA